LSPPAFDSWLVLLLVYVSIRRCIISIDSLVDIFVVAAAAAAALQQRVGMGRAAWAVSRERSNYCPIRPWYEPESCATLSRRKDDDDDDDDNDESLALLRGVESRGLLWYALFCGLGIRLNPNTCRCCCCCCCCCCCSLSRAAAANAVGLGSIKMLRCRSC